MKSANQPLVDEKISKQSAVDLVFERMKDLIKQGSWPVMERIPSESELADLFHLNRLTIRMALQRLNLLGLLQTRAGEGTFVTEFSVVSYMEQVSEFYSDEMISDIVDFRTAVELQCCRLAMDSATEEELAELARKRDAIDEAARLMYAQGHQPEYLALVDADLAFHEHITAIAHNSLLSAAYIMARGTIYQHLLMIVKQRVMHRKGLLNMGEKASRSVHTEIYEAIIRKDYEACKKSFLDMVDYKTDLYNL